MPIVVQPSGAAELYGGLARLAGESIAAQRDMERAERNAQALREHQWNMERLELEHQWDIEAFNRSQAWNIEKMEQASKLDYAREEKERQDTLDEYRVKKKAIMDSNILSDNEKQLWLLQLDTKLPLAASYMKPEKELSPKDALIRQLMTGEGVEAPTEPATQPPTYTGPAPAGGGIGDWIKQFYYGPEYYKGTRGIAPTTPTAPVTSVRMESAPDIALDSYWPRLTNEQKEKVWAAFNNGYTAEEIIASLGIR
jgi:hypothetical protein